MRRSPWSLALFGLTIGTLAIAGGTVVGGDIGPMTAGYGLLVALAALYALAGLAIRNRVWRRLWSERSTTPRSVAAHRLF